MNATQTADFDLERIIPDYLSDDPHERETFAIHSARYEFASSYVRGKRVLDIACGAGYGSAILAAAGAASVTGVDLSAETIAYARERYGNRGIEFINSDGMTFDPQRTFDVVVSLETIEHVPDARGFVKRLATFVAPGGVLIGSVPTTFSTDINPYHLHDFSAAEFRELFAHNGLTTIDEMTQAQRYFPLRMRSTTQTSRRSYQIKPLLRYYATHPRALVRRMVFTVKRGFVNEYLVLVGQR
ncbi:MAG: class I SAM-dependent methyltransferase [Kofleriaceae bacterium]